MKELLIVGFIALVGFTAAFYQSYRDKQRWRRITSGMSLFGERADIPPLKLDGKSFEAHERRVMVIWGDLKKAGFETVSEAIQKVEHERQAGAARAREARIFAWDGETWKRRR